MKLCTDCGSTLEPDEEESPRRNEDGNIVCDQCFDDHYQHLCPICEEHFYEDFNQEISPKHFIITRQAEKRGCYLLFKYLSKKQGFTRSSSFHSMQME